MSISLTLNGTSYTIPQTGNRGWGTNVTSFLTGVSNGTLQKTGGNFTLTGNVNFGPNYGLTALWLSARTTPISTAGFMRLGVTDTFGWRNNANSGNLLLGVNGSDVLTFNGTVIIPGSISSLTGDVTATGPGAAAATIAAIQGKTVSGTSGTGNVIFSASPTFTGTIAGASQTLSGTLAVTGVTTVGSGTNTTAQLLVGAVSNAIDAGSALRLQNANVSTNWEISSNLRGSAGNLNITPSTVGGGTTYTTPVVSIVPGGGVTLSSTLAVTGTSTLAAVNASATLTVAQSAGTGVFINGFLNNSGGAYIEYGNGSGTLQHLQLGSFNTKIGIIGLESRGANDADMWFSASGGTKAMTITHGNKIGIGMVNPSNILDVTGTFGASGASVFGSTVSATQYTSTIAVGTAPLVVTSTTLVPNLYVARAVLADSATTNANLTGVITSVGNATSIASQTGTGTKFVVDTAPILTAAQIGGTATTQALALSQFLVTATSGGIESGVATYGGAPRFTGYRAQGTESAVTAVTSGLPISQFGAGGYDGTAWTGRVGFMTIASDEAWNATSHGTRITFSTTLNTTNTQTERMRIDNAGNVGIGMTPVRVLDVTGTFGATGAATLGSTLAVTTSTTSPLIIGGSGAASTLTLQSTSGAGTTDAIIFQTASQVEAMRVDSAGGLRIGTTGVLGASNLENLSVLTTTTGGGSVTQAAHLQDLVTGNTAQTTTQSGLRLHVDRTITTSTTDTGQVQGLFISGPTQTVPAGQVITNTNSNGYIGITITTNPTITGGGTINYNLWSGLFIGSSSAATGTRKIGIRLGAPTGATNNAYITDNTTFTGDYFINSTSTNASLLSGALTVSNTTDSSSTSTGAIISTGGLGIAKAAFIGTTLNVAGATTLVGALSQGSSAQFTSDASGNIVTSGNITGPTHIGGTTSSSTLTLESTSGAGTTDAIVFKTASQVEAMRVDSAGGLRIGSTTPIGTKEALTVSATYTTSQSSAMGANIRTTYSGDTAQTATMIGMSTRIGRTIVTTAPTDTAQFRNLQVLQPTFDFGSSTGQVITNTNSSGYMGVNVNMQPTITGTGTLAFTQWTGVDIGANAFATGTRKTQLHIAAPTGATYNAYIADNASFTSDYFISSTITSPSSLAGVLTIANTTDSTTTATGAIITTGGVGIAKAVNVGTTLTVAGVSTLNGQLIAKGTATNDSASAGYIGEYVESLVTTVTNFPGATGAYGDATSISLTAGDWDVTAVLNQSLNGATMTQYIEIGISTTAGNFGTGLVAGVNDSQGVVASSSRPVTQVVPSSRMSLSGTTTVYLKALAFYSAGNPQYTCRLSARRMR